MTEQHRTSYYFDNDNKDIEQEIELYKRKASVGNSDSMNDLALCYERGHGVEKDIQKAIELYRKSANLGNVPALYNLGFSYEHGKGVEKNIQKAFEYYKKAAQSKLINK